ncbi:MAG: hypothetical protein ABSD42_13795 [Candidatus Bathyarchaeia archaeon]|jgi:HAMP domain-containing protein
MSESWYISTLLSGIAGAIVAAIVTLVFSFKIERRMLRVVEIRNELEKAYGPIYSL